MSYQRKVEVCFSPALFPFYFKNKDCIVVVIDVFRATSAICTAFEHGVKKMIPVATIEEAMEYQKQGFLVGAERGGEVVEGFDFGNSPFSYMGEHVKGASIVLTTTNGTQAIEVAKGAAQIVVGSFLNLSALSAWLKGQSKDVLLLCAGWKDRFNLEDTLFAGAVAKALLEDGEFTMDLEDSAIASVNLYERAQNDLMGYLADSSHRKRLARLNLEKDIEFCLKPDQTSVIPILKDGALVNLSTLQLA